MQCVCVCVSVNVSACVFMYMRALVYSQAIAIAVCEGGLGKLHYSSTAFPDDFRSATQKFLGLRERLSQLFLPLHKLWVTLRTYTHKKKKKTSACFIHLLYSTKAYNSQRTYFTLQHKLFPSFDAQQDTLLVFNLRFFHGYDLLHRQQVLLQR